MNVVWVLTYALMNVRTLMAPMFAAAQMGIA